MKPQINKAIDEFKNSLIEKFEDDLISIALFGSQLRKPRWDSDIDVIVIIRNLPENWRERDNRFSDLEYDISVKYGNSISAVYYTPKEIEFGINVKDRLFLGALLDYRIVYDKDGFFNENIETQNRTG